MALLTLLPSDNMTVVYNMSLYDGKLGLFDMIDDFATLDTDKWHIYTDVGSVTHIGDTVEVYGPGNWNNGIVTKEKVNKGPLYSFLNLKVKRNRDDKPAAIGIVPNNGSPYFVPGGYGFYFQTAQNLFYLNNGSKTDTGVNYAANTYYNFVMKYTVTGIDYYLNDTYLVNKPYSRSDDYIFIGSYLQTTTVDSVSLHYANGLFTVHSNGDTKIDATAGYYLDIATFNYLATNIDFDWIKFYSSNDPTDPADGDYTYLTSWSQLTSLANTYHRYYWLQIKATTVNNDFAYFENITVDKVSADVTPPTDVSSVAAASGVSGTKFDLVTTFTGGSTLGVGTPYAGANLEIEKDETSYFLYADDTLNTVEDFSLLKLVGEDSERAVFELLQQDEIPTRFRLNTWDTAENKNSSDWYDFGPTTPDLSITDTEATITKSKDRFTNILVATKQGENTWIALGTRQGNGTIEFNQTLPNGNYTARVMSVGSPGTVSDAVDFVISNPLVINPYPGIHWDRWVFASICQHFDDRRGTLPMYVEGTHRDTRELEDFFELRVDGPWYSEISKNYWWVFIEINVLIQSAKNNTDFHRIRKMTGIISQILERCIKVYKYGNEPYDDSSLLGVLERQDDRRGKNADRIQINHFGQIEPKLKLEQSTVEAHYVMKLSV